MLLYLLDFRITMNERLAELTQQRIFLDAQICTQLDNLVETFKLRQGNLIPDLLSLSNLTSFQTSLLQLHLDKIRAIAENVSRTMVHVPDNERLYDELCLFRAVETSLLNVIENNRT